jgi:hypothetical protein
MADNNKKQRFNKLFAYTAEQKRARLNKQKQLYKKKRKKEREREKARFDTTTNKDEDSPTVETATSNMATNKNEDAFNTPPPTTGHETDAMDTLLATLVKQQEEDVAEKERLATQEGKLVGLLREMQAQDKTMLSNQKERFDEFLRVKHTNDVTRSQMNVARAETVAIIKTVSAKKVAATTPSNKTRVRALKDSQQVSLGDRLDAKVDSPVVALKTPPSRHSSGLATPVVAKRVHHPSPDSCHPARKRRRKVNAVFRLAATLSRNSKSTRKNDALPRTSTCSRLSWWTVACTRNGGAKSTRILFETLPNKPLPK